MKILATQQAVEHVARRIGLGTNELQETVAEIGAHYRRETRLIGSKERTLFIPSEHLKSVQRTILETFLYPLPAHEAAFCTPGRGVLAAVRRHTGHRYLLHLDIKDFFPSVRPSRVKRAFERTGFDPDVAGLLTHLTTVNNHLPQGAPTSVAVADLVLGRLDRSLWGLCQRFGLTYTRYVDDIAISGGARLRKAEKYVRQIFESCHWRLSDKGGLTDPGHRPHLLGVMLGRTLNVDPTYLADLRTTLEEKAKSGEIVSEAEMRKLAGKIAWVRAVNSGESETLAQLAARLRTAEGIARG